MHCTIKKLKRRMSIFLDCSRTESTMAMKRPLCDFEAVSPFLQRGSVFPRLQISFVVFHLNNKFPEGADRTSAADPVTPTPQINLLHLLNSSSIQVISRRSCVTSGSSQEMETKITEVQPITLRWLGVFGGAVGG